jgi:hypothetical protein
MKSGSMLVVLLLCLSLVLTAGFTAPQKPITPPVAVAAQDSGTVTVDSARPVTEIVGEKTAYLATVSPDGNYIAYGKQSGRGKDRVLQLCIFEFESAGKKCSDLSPSVFNGYPYQFQWSPDSQYIAFSENPVQMGSESDIWLFDRAAGTFTDLTEDNLVGNWQTFQSEGDTVPLDLLPMWNPNDEQIYFWRVVPLGNMRFTIGIYSVAPAGGDAELVRDLTTNFAATLPLFDYEALFLDGVSALSPDASTIAALLTSYDDMGQAQQALWTIDLTDTTVAPKQLAGVTEFSSGVPEWAASFPPQAQGLSWTGDGAGIVVVANSSAGTSMPFQVYYYVDVASDTTTPVVNFSGLEDWESYSEIAPGSDLPWRAYSPWTGSLSPAGDKLLMINDLGGTVAMFTSPLPPTGDLPVVSASAEDSPMSGVANSSRGEGGKVLAYGLLMTITEQ